MKILLSNGISYDEFGEAAKRAVIKATESDFPEQRVRSKNFPQKIIKKQTDSYISAFTGLARLDVARIRKEIDGTKPEKKAVNRQANVIHGWCHDSRFVDAQGQPRILPKNGENSFALLVKEYAGDLKATAMLQALVCASLVKEEDDNIILVERGYFPYGDPVQLAEVIGQQFARFHKTVEHNLQCQGEQETRFETAAVASIPLERLHTIKKYLDEKNLQYLREIDAYLAQQSIADLDHENATNVTTGVGIYYFEERLSGDE